MKKTKGLRDLKESCKNMTIEQLKDLLKEFRIGLIKARAVKDPKGMPIAPVRKAIAIVQTYINQKQGHFKKK